MKNELVLAQEKLNIINKLTNSLQKIDNKQIKNDIAYFIHTIIEADSISLDMYRSVTGYSIEAHKELFVRV